MQNNSWAKIVRRGTLASELGRHETNSNQLTKTGAIVTKQSKGDGKSRPSAMLPTNSSQPYLDNIPNFRVLIESHYNLRMSPRQEILAQSSQFADPTKPTRVVNFCSLNTGQQPLIMDGKKARYSTTASRDHKLIQSDIVEQT